MSNNSKSKTDPQPKLRFLEFRGSRNWENQPIEKFLDYQQPTPYLVDDTNYSNEYLTPVLTAGKTFILGYTDERHGIFENGLPVIIFDDFTTATQYVDFPFKAKSSAMKILLAKNGASIKFMYEAMQMISYEVGAHERHWISNFAPMHVSLPVDIKEQQKIADCLSSLDEVIEAERQKLEAFQRHKKGLLQNLFPVPGKTLPNLRFSGFKGKWEITTLIDFSDFVKNRISSEKIVAECYVSTENIISDFGGVTFSNKAPSTGSATKFRAGDVLFSNIRPYLRKVWIADRDGSASNDVLVLRSKEKEHSTLLAQYIKNDIFINYVMRDPKGLKMPRGDIEQIKKFPICYPSDSNERQKITDLLSSLDKIIELQNQKIIVLRQHKKGLMQQLFPMPGGADEEV